MNTHNTPDTPPDAARPGRAKRALNVVGWYTPELVGAAATAAAAATVWGPLGLLSAALGVRIVADQAVLAHRNHAARRQFAENRAAHRARLEKGEDVAGNTAAPDDEATDHNDGWEVAG